MTTLDYTAATPSNRTDNRYAVAVMLAVFALVSGMLAVLSGAFLEADGVTHYMYARWAFEEPHLLFNVWGRPIVTTLHALPAQLPGDLGHNPWALVAVRWMSLLLALGCGLASWQVAKGLGLDRPGLATLFFLGTPLVLLHSFSELTELPFALLSITMVLAYQRKRWWAMALLAGLLPAARPEGIGFLLVAACGLLVHGRWKELPLCLVGTVVWAVGGWYTTGMPQAEESMPFYGWPEPVAGIASWLPASWPYSGESVYDSGHALKFVGMLPVVVGPFLLPMTLVGVLASLRGNWRDHTSRVRWVVLGLPLMVLGVHSVLHATGKMASSGDVRYLVAVSPMWAILTAIGWEALARRFQWQPSWHWPAWLALGPMMLLQTWYPVVPLKLDTDSQQAIALANWLDETVQPGTPLLINHPVVWYALDGNPMGGATKDKTQTAETGAVLVWHEIYSMYNADARFVIPTKPLEAAGWRDITPAGFAPRYRVFEKTSGGAEDNGFAAPVGSAVELKGQ